MNWEVVYTDEFWDWWDGLNEREQDDVDVMVQVLGEHGPGLRRPRVGGIRGSKHPNLKELIIQHEGRPYRVLFAFDPRRNAVLLIGGDKTGNPNWYEEYVPRADDIYDDYLKETGQVDGAENG